MVHWGQPTTPAMARQHTLQLPLLLEMAKKEGMSRLGCCLLHVGASLEPRKYIGWPSATLRWHRQYGRKAQAHKL